MARTHWLLRVILVLGLISTLGTSVVFADPGAPLSPDDSAGVYQPTDDLDALTRGGGGRDRDRDRDDDEDNRGRGRARITWSVRKVEECLGPGESLSKTVSFTSNRAMQNVELDVRPDSSVVDFSPSSFASVAANASNSVTLSLKLPSSTHRSQYVSLIHLTSGHRNLGRPLQVKIKVKQADGTCQRGDDDDDDDDNNNNQHLPRLSVNDVNVTEGNGGTTNATFTVSASSAPTQTITVNYATVNGTATGGASCTTGVDYVTSTGTVTLNAGETSKTFTVQVCGDTTGEANETFFVDLSAPVNASLGDDDGKATILDDDGGQGTQSSLSINDVTVTEGNSGTTNATFTVSLAASSTQVVTVSFATANGSTDPATGGASCTTGVDYVTSTGTVTLNAGETSKTFTVQVCGDTTVEPNETFLVNLSGATNATIADAEGKGTINNDDSQTSQPSLSINDVLIAEGNSGTTNATFTVSLSASSTQVVTVNYATANGTATGDGSCSGTADFINNSSSLTFNAGETSKTVSIQVCGDTTVESDETFFVNLSGATNATVADAEGKGTITNDDQQVVLPSISINNVTITEGASGTISSAVFTVSLTAASTQTVTVSFATANGSTNPATGGASCTTGIDYVTNSGTVTFNAGETAKTVSIQVCGDSTNEPNETFTVTLSASSNATIGTAVGTGTINNDD